MIEVRGLTKRFGDFTALCNVTCTIPEGCIYGMVGSNGAGKSTLLRLISGVYRPDAGEIFIDGQPIYENTAMKARIAFVPDELYFLGGADMRRMARLYAAAYPAFDKARFEALTASFRLDPTKPLSTFSKGMRRQASIILSLSSRPKYIFFDETFDGLDPIMRTLVKKLIVEDVLDRHATAIITSHSLRELEDTCDQLALLHKGGLVLESDVQNLKTCCSKFRSPSTMTMTAIFLRGWTSCTTPVTARSRPSSCAATASKRWRHCKRSCRCCSTSCRCRSRKCSPMKWKRSAISSTKRREKHETHTLLGL